MYGLMSVQGNAFVVDFDTPATGSGIFATPSIGVDQTVTNANGSGIDVTFNIAAGPVTEPVDLVNATPLLGSTQFTRATGNSLILDGDFENIGTGFESFSVTITFTGVVESVSISLLDVDQGGPTGGGTVSFQDQIAGISASGTGVSAAMLAAGPGATVVPGTSITGAATVGAGSAGADASISFTGTDIDQVEFSFFQGPDSTAFSVTQRLGIESVVFTVPEMSTWVSLAFLLVLGLSHGLVKQCRARQRLAVP